MKRNKIIILLVAAFIALPAAAQNDLPRLLQDVESNNLLLQSESYAAKGRTYEARTGNSLEPISVDYASVWDSPQAAGKSGELEIAQEFDLPMLYVTRSRMAKKLAEQYNAEYLAMRQQILLEAKEVYLELCTLKKTADYLNSRIEASGRVAKLLETRYEASDATLVEKNRAEFEYLLLKESASQNDLRIIELRQRLVSLNGGKPTDYSFVMPASEVMMPLDNLLADWEDVAPEMTVLRMQEEVAGQELRLSKQQALPKVAVGYKMEYGTGEMFNGITAGLSIPMFSNRFNVKRARAFETAARLNRENAVLEKRNTVTEMYMKAQYIGGLLESFGEMPHPKEYVDMLGRLLEAGQISIVDYYSDLGAFYSTIETRLKVDLEYRLGLARLNVIYM